MTNFADAVQDTVRLCGGRVVGRTRLQKITYFLEACGLGYGLDFDYHYYGPYSEELASAAEDAEALDLIASEWSVSQRGAEYVTYRLGKASETAEVELDEMSETRSRLIRVLRNVDAVTLELAATSDFLAKNGFENDPWKEVQLRKSLKASPSRIARAKKLLKKIHEFEAA